MDYAVHTALEIYQRDFNFKLLNMNKIENYIKYHTLIDFKRFTCLDESTNHIDNINIYAKAITDKLLSFIVSSKGEQINLSKLIIYRSDIPLNNVFFDELHFEKSFFLINSDEKTPADIAGYLPDKSGIQIDTNGNKKYIVTFRIDTITSLEYIKSDYPFLFAHEIAHAYEDYCRNPDSLIEDKSLADENERHFKPGFTYRAMTSNNKFLRKFAEILYFSFDDEVTAMKNEIFQELFLIRGNIEDFNSGNAQLKQTRVYRRIKYIEKYIYEIEHITDYHVQSELENLYELTYGTYINDYNKLLSKVNAKYTIARNKIISAAGKGLCFAYNTRNVPDKF